MTIEDDFRNDRPVLIELQAKEWLPDAWSVGFQDLEEPCDFIRNLVEPLLHIGDASCHEVIDDLSK